MRTAWPRALGMVLLLAVVTAGLGGRGCSRPAGGGPVRGVVTIAPLAGLVRALLPEGSEGAVLIAPGRSEHGYELTAAGAGALARADLVVYVAPGLERTVTEYLEKHPATGRRELGVAGVIGVANV